MGKASKKKTKKKTRPPNEPTPSPPVFSWETLSNCAVSSNIEISESIDLNSWLGKEMDETQMLLKEIRRQLNFIITLQGFSLAVVLAFVVLESAAAFVSSSWGKENIKQLGKFLIHYSERV